MPRPRRHNYPPYSEEYEPKGYGIIAPQVQRDWADSVPETPDGRLTSGYNHWLDEERKRRVRLEAKRTQI